jgi:cleavage and polyadenylation specificity factor subunit 4
VHWIKQRCTRGETCDYLHSYDSEKLPICRYFTQNGSCHKEKECVYRHPKPTDNINTAGGIKKSERCPYYDRCFCKLGNFGFGLYSECQFLHTPGEQRICPNYLLGFCPLGPECPDFHLKSLLNPKDIQLSVLANFPPELNWCEGNSDKPLPTAPVYSYYRNYHE